MNLPKSVIVILGLLLSCSDGPTGVVVNIYTEYSVPDEIDRIGLTLFRSKDPFLVKEYYVTDEGSLPLRILITQDNDIEEIIGIEVTGKKGGLKVVSEFTETAFVRHKMVKIDIYLKRLISDAGIDGSNTTEDVRLSDLVEEISDSYINPGCDQGSCGQNAMCKDGDCICNMGFDNCNQDWSDGCETDLLNNLNHCGGCTNICSPANVKGAVCNMGNCDYTECNIMYEDNDNIRKNGCESFNYFPKVYGGKGNEILEDIKVTSDGGLIVVGTTNSCCFGDKDLLVVRLNKRGDLKWQRVIGGERKESGPFSVYEYNRLYYIIGGTSSFGEGNVSALLIILDQEGNTVSSKIMDTDIQQWIKFSKMECRNDNNCLILGSASLTGQTGPDIYELSIDKDLSLTHQRIIKIPNAQEDPSFISGWEGYIYFTKNVINQTESSSLVFMVDENRDIHSAKEIYGGIGIALTRCIQIGSEGIYCSGYSGSSNSNRREIILLRYLYANGGDIVWQRAYGGVGDDLGTISDASSMTGIIIGGRCEQDGIINTLFMNIDTDGNPRTITLYRETMGGYVVKYTNDLFLIGSTSLGYADGGMDLLIIPVSPQGINVSHCPLNIDKDIKISSKDPGLKIRSIASYDILNTDLSFRDINIGIKDMQDFKAGSICEK